MNVSFAGRAAAFCALGCAAVFIQGCAKKVAIARPAVPAAVTAFAPVKRQVSDQPTPTRAVTASTKRSSQPDQATKDRMQALLNRIEDAYFDYNADRIRADAQSTLYKDAVALSQILAQYPDYKLTIEGFCDERGSAEYNLALGDTRAKNAKSYLESSGVSGSQIKTVSFGKERQACSDHTEACWQRNRRIHITQGQG